VTHLNTVVSYLLIGRWTGTSWWLWWCLLGLGYYQVCKAHVGNITCHVSSLCWPPVPRYNN